MIRPIGALILSLWSSCSFCADDRQNNYGQFCEYLAAKMIKENLQKNLRVLRNIEYKIGSSGNIIGELDIVVIKNGHIILSVTEVKHVSDKENIDSAIERATYQLDKFVDTCLFAERCTFYSRGRRINLVPIVDVATEIVIYQGRLIEELVVAFKTF